MKNTNKIYRLCTGVLCVAVSIMAIFFSQVSSPAKLIVAVMFLLCGIIMIAKRNAPKHDEALSYVIVFMAGMSIGLINTETNLNLEMLTLLILIIIFTIFNLIPVFLKKKDENLSNKSEN